MPATGSSDSPLARADERCHRLTLLLQIATAVAAHVAPVAAAESCVSAKSRPVQAIEAIRLVPRDFPAGLLPIVERAMSFWNDAGCNGDAGFPRFRFASEEPHRIVNVRWVQGINAATEGSCGSFVGSEIVLYSHARDGRGRRERSCGTPPRLAETLAHELGHALGLDDQYGTRCAGYIMGQLVLDRSGAPLERRVRAEECAAADAAFLTLAERGGRAAEDLLAAADDAPPAGFTSRAGAAGSRPRSARIALGIPATESDGYRP